ncbi:MAG: response regulator receiver sensor signal transduction histidine kinase [Verrucomicrobiales bacterium]|nr:response regulator receiver sensor signal transduction histidine kinase [Verrucomicrobiales bacterium]
MIEFQFSPTRKARILAVDDQKDSLRLLQIRLQNAGMECVTCADGNQALDVLSTAEPFDVVILDVMMPHMDGYELCRRIKAEEKTKDLPVLFLTAKFATEDKVKGLEVGGHDYLSKPVEQQELLARTRSALRVKQLQDRLKEQLQLQEQVNRLHQGMLSEHWQKTLGQLAASLAHEINNPLAAALGSVQLIAMEDGLNANWLARLQVVDRSLQRAGQKLRSLLLIAQTGRQSHKVSLSQMMQDILTVINFQVVMNRISVTFENSNTPCDWFGNPSDLARAVLYVLNNAIEALQNVANPCIRVEIQSVGDQNVIRISDNGVGIQPQLRDRVFEPFFTTKPPPHNGIGLFLGREIVTAAGGTIDVNSAGEGRGTDVSIHLAALDPVIRSS